MLTPPPYPTPPLSRRRLRLQDHISNLQDLLKDIQRKWKMDREIHEQEIDRLREENERLKVRQSSMGL